MKGFRHHCLIVTAALALLGAPHAAWADCTSPAGVESQTQYDFTGHVLKYCDGTNWLSMGSGASSGTAGYIQFSNGSGGFSNSGTTPGQQLFWDNTNKRLGIGTVTPATTISMGGEASRNIAIERTSSGTNGNDLYLTAGGAKSATADLNGGSLVFRSGVSTGTGASTIIFQTYTPGTTGTADNTLSTKMIVTGSGNVGIGTSAPAFKLHLLETSNAAETLPLHLQNAGTSNNTTVGISFTPASGSSTGAKITSNQVQNGNMALGFSTTGPTDGLNYRMYISGPGNVGIGTTSPVALLNLGGNRSLASWTTAGANFHVNATTLTDTTGTGTIATRVANSFNQPTLASSSAVTLTDAATVYIAGAPIAGTNTTITNRNSLHVAAGNSYFGGNVGIGTTSPSYLLSLGGEAARTIGMERTTAGTNGYYLVVSAGGAKPSTADLNGGDLSLVSGVSTGTGSSNIYFSTATPQGSTNTTDNLQTTKMTIAGNGNVGIGNKSPPVYTLTLGREATRTIGIERSSPNNSGASLIVTAGGAVSSVADKGGGSLYLDSGIATGTGSSNIYFRTATPQASTNTTDNTPTSKMTILGNGNVGIGTTTPAAKLDVNGFMRLAKNAAQPIACSATNDGAIALTSQYTLCACKGGSSAWVRTTDGTTACTW